jgi:hypothetical protein
VYPVGQVSAILSLYTHTPRAAHLLLKRLITTEHEETPASVMQLAHEPANPFVGGDRTTQPLAIGRVRNNTPVVVCVCRLCVCVSVQT